MDKKTVGLLVVLLGVACTGDFHAGPRASEASAQQSQNSSASSLNTRNDRGPLLEAIYQASRQEHGKDSLRSLDQARELITQGADVKARDAQGRTALHWTAIGAMYAREE